MRKYNKIITRGVTFLLVTVVCYSGATNECHNQPADIGFLLDESGSVGNSHFQLNLDFVTNFVDVFHIGDTAVKISAYAFHRRMGDGFHFKCCNDKTSVKSSINRIVYNSGGENFEMALAFAKNHMFQKSNGMREFSVKILIFFTDGRSDVQDGGKLLHQLGVIVYAVGVGPRVDSNQLKKIATNDSYVFKVSDYGSLVGQISQNIRSKTCDDLVNAPNPCFKNPQPCKNQGTCIPQTGAKYKCICPVGYTGHQCQTDIDYCYGVICHNGGTCIDGLTDYTCICADQFTGQHCEIDICKPFPSDVVFVLDSSNSFSQKYFNISKGVLQSATDQWKITQNGFQVAIVSYGEFSHLELNFDITMNKLKFDDFVSKMNLKSGISEIQKGLNQARNLLYNRNRFVSSTPVKKYIILISDGLPSTPSAITTMRTHGINILAVAVGEDVSHHFLSLIVGGSENVFPHSNDRLWHYMTNALVDPSCNFCKISEEADVIFAVDTSNGWHHSDLTTTVPNIINKIVAGIKLGPTKTQIALLTYATSSNLRFDFNQYNNESERLNLRRQLSSFFQTTGSMTNITDLIESAANLSVDSKKGARLSAKKFLIVFSSYQNNISIEDCNILDNLRKNVEIFAVGLDQSDEKFTIMSEIASTSFHIGIDGGMSVNSIETFIASLLEQFKTVHCNLP